MWCPVTAVGILVIHRLNFEQASGSGMQQDADSGPSDLQHSGKHSTEHSETGGDSKRLHTTSDDVSFPHGDVVPQTPQSEHGRDVLG